MPMCASIRTGSPISCSLSCMSDVVALGRTECRARRRSVGGAVRRARTRRTHARAASTIASPNTCPAAIWRCGATRCSPSAASIRSTCAPATTWTCAGGCRRAAGRSASRRPRSSGITTAPRLAHTGVSKSATAKARCGCSRTIPDKFVGSRIQWRGHVYSPLPFVRSLFGTRVNAGPWGTAPFPSVYRTDAFPLFFAPHTLTWQVAALVLMSRRAAALGTDSRRAWPDDGWRRGCSRSQRRLPAACAMRSPRISARCRRCPADRRR